MDWTRGRTIGRGSSATVSIATSRLSGEVFAVKSAEFSQSELLKREQSILSKLNCPQIIAYKGWNVTSENNGKPLYNLCIEYAPGGTIIDAIRKQGGCLNEATIRSYTRAILRGLEYLHSNGVAHCDIKGSNVLITDDGVKIADLGCAKWVDLASPALISGTPVFMAPEVARGEEQGFPADVWALGCTVIEMATGRAPWSDVSDPVSAIYRIGFSGDVPEIPGFMSKQGKDFLIKCFKKDPRERWSASELLQHDFLEKPDLFSQEICWSNSDTPTCVLDQDFWDSMEELETTQNWISTSCSNSPKERIRRLSGAGPNWAWDENWVTVRSNSSSSSSSSREPETVCCGCSQDCTMLHAYEPTSGAVDAAWFGQDQSLIYVNKPTWSGGMESCNSSRNCSNSDDWHRKGGLLLMGCPCMKDDVCGNLGFENKGNLLCFLQYKSWAWPNWLQSSTLIKLEF